MPLEPRDYQLRGIQDARREFAKGVKRMILVAPTGSGKTFLSSIIVKNHIDKHPENRALFLAYGRELIWQSSETFQGYGIPNGIIMSGVEPMPEYRVQVASIDTLLARAVKRSKMSLPKSTLVIADEAHRSAANKWQKLLALYPDSYHVGLTATPIRGDGRTMAGAGWQSLVNITTYQELLSAGHLVPVRVFAPSEPDLKGVRTVAGDYNQRQLQDAMDKVQLVGDVFTHWHQHASDRQTVIFASGVEHSIHLRDEFRHHGIKAEHIDGNTPSDERDEILRRFGAGDIQVVSNYGCLCEGWDSPQCSALILCRPTKKLGPYRQMVGRILRPYPGKTDALILDHSGAVHRHGWPTDDIEWDLDKDVNIQKRHEAKRKARITSDASNEPITCKMCHAVRQGGFACPNCGFKPERRGKGVDMADGLLSEVDRENNLRILAERQRLMALPKQKYWDHCVGVCIAKNWPIKRATGMYKERFGVWPRGFKNLPRGKDEYQMPAREWWQVMVSRTEG